MDAGTTPAFGLAAFHADPERRLRAAVIRRAGELGRASLGLSGWMGTLVRRAWDGTGPAVTEGKRAEVLRLTIRALAWATALRRRLLVESRHDKAAAMLRPTFAPVRIEEKAARVPAAAALAVAVAVGDVPGDLAGDLTRVLPVAPYDETAGVVFVSASILDTRLLAAARRAGGAPRTVVIRADDMIARRRAIRDRRKCAEDEAAKLAVGGMGVDEALANICRDLIDAAQIMGETAAVGAVKEVALDLGSRLVAYETAMKERASAEAGALAEDGGPALAEDGGPAQDRWPGAERVGDAGRVQEDWSAAFARPQPPAPQTPAPQAHAPQAPSPQAPAPQVGISQPPGRARFRRAEAGGSALWREELQRREAYREAKRTGKPLPDPW